MSAMSAETPEAATRTVRVQRTLAGSSSSVCRYFGRNMCRFGELCRFAHVRTEPEQAASAETSASDADAAIDGQSTASGGNAPSGQPHGHPDNWINAPVFVPRRASDCAGAAAPISYAQALGTDGASGLTTYATEAAAAAAHNLCPYRVHPTTGRCSYGDRCAYDHRPVADEPFQCDLCGNYLPAAVDAVEHRVACMRQHELDMELSFAIARSKDKMCGVCFEVVMEKSGSEQRFGILPNCNHTFCLQCIRKWRMAEQFDKKIIRACPECRVTSDYVCPSAFWVDSKADKDKLLDSYRNAMETKNCKYFKQGQGKCPFGNKCFYRHALENGTLIDVGLPPKPVRRQNHLGDEELIQHLSLWDFLADRETQQLMVENVMAFSLDSDSAESPISFDPEDILNITLHGSRFTINRRDS